jgi:hypothetical protein
MERRFEKNPSFVAREVAGEFILVPTRQRAEETASIYVLNAVSSLIWGRIDAQVEVAEIRDALVAEFDVETAEATADLLEFLQQLEAIGAVSEVR